MFRFALAFVLALSLASTASAQTDPNLLTLETNKGRVVIRLRPDLAPKHAERLKTLAKEGFYNNVPFHRVMEGFMAQTGDGQRGDGTGGSKYPNLPAEFSQCRSSAASSAWRGAATASIPPTASSSSCSPRTRA